MTYKYTNNKVIYPKLSYRIVGMLFNVWNSVGYGHKESFYQKAMEHIRTIRIDFQKCKAFDFGCGVGRLTQSLAD